MRSFAQKAPQPTSNLLGRPRVAQNAALSPIQQLQRRVGNQALQRMLQTHAGKAKEDAPDAPLRIQPKLTINAPGDVHEQEADRVAEQVMRMAEPSAQSGNPPILGMTTVSGPTATDCGGMDWRIDWTLDKPAPKGGAIVQKVHHDATIIECGVGGKQFLQDYWEMWSVKKGQARPVRLASNYDDVFKYDPPAKSTLKGKFIITGEAEFYPGQTPTGFKTDPTSDAGYLPMRKTDPALTGGTGPVSHSMTAEWNCCSDSPDRTTKLTTN